MYVRKAVRGIECPKLNTLYLSNKTICRPPQSREPIPLNDGVLVSNAKAHAVRATSHVENINAWSRLMIQCTPVPEQK
jgi:hypothetical protein